MSDTAALINQLLTNAGMIMEDASEAMLIDDGSRSPAARILILHRVAADLSALAIAAGVVQRRGD